MKRRIIIFCILSFVIYFIFFMFVPIRLGDEDNIDKNSVMIITDEVEKDVDIINHNLEEKIEKTISSFNEKINVLVEITLKNKFTSEIDAITNIEDKQEWFISYKEILNNYSEIIKTKTVYDVLSTEEIDIFCHIVEAEVTGGDFISKVNVANVILNRINNEQFPNTIKEVVFQEGQFSPIIDGRFYSVEISESTILAIEYAYMFEDTTNGALFFESGNNYVHMSYANYLFTDNVGHHFYK